MASTERTCVRVGGRSGVLVYQFSEYNHTEEGGVIFPIEFSHRLLLHLHLNLTPFKRATKAHRGPPSASTSTAPPPDPPANTNFHPMNHFSANANATCRSVLDRRPNLQQPRPASHSFHSSRPSQHLQVPDGLQAGANSWADALVMCRPRCESRGGGRRSGSRSYRRCRSPPGTLASTEGGPDRMEGGMCGPDGIELATGGGERERSGGRSRKGKEGNGVDE